LHTTAREPAVPRARQAQLAADAAAIVNDQLAVVEAASSTVGTFL
jgi:hypothetical protein